MLCPWRSSRLLDFDQLLFAKRVFSLLSLFWGRVRQVLTAGCVLCARHQNPTLFVGWAFVGLTIRQVVLGFLAHHLAFLGGFAVFAAALKSAAEGAALEPTLFIFSPEPALIRARLALMLLYRPGFISFLPFQLGTAQSQLPVWGF